MAAILHKVKKDETVFSLCCMFRMSHARFVELNPQFGEFGYRDERLYPGERVVVGDSADPLELLKAVNARDGR